MLFISIAYIALKQDSCWYNIRINNYLMVNLLIISEDNLSA